MLLRQAYLLVEEAKIEIRKNPTESERIIAEYLRKLETICSSKSLTNTSKNSSESTR